MWGLLHIDKWFKTKEAADAFCVRKNRTARKYQYKPMRSHDGAYFIVGYRKK